MTPPPSKRNTPAAGTPVEDDWGADTGVGDPPKRAATSPGSYSQQSSSARAAFREIRALGEKLDQHSQVDKIALDKIHAKLDAQDGVLINIRVEQSGTKAALEAMTSELRHKRELTRIEFESEATHRVEKERTHRARMDNRTKIILAVVALVSSGAGILIKWLTE